MCEQAHIDIYSHKKIPQILSMHIFVYIHKPLLSTQTHKVNMNTGMLNRTHRHAAHIHPQPQQKVEPGWGPHLPGMAGRHDLVPRVVLLPFPSARTLLWQKACIPMSEQAVRTQQADGQESTLPSLPPMDDLVAMWMPWDGSQHLPWKRVTMYLPPSCPCTILSNWKMRGRRGPAQKSLPPIWKQGSALPATSPRTGWMPAVPWH